MQYILYLADMQQNYPWSHAPQFNCPLQPWCVCQRGTQPCRSEGLPSGVGLRSSRRAVWWILPARPENVFLWSRTSAGDGKRQYAASYKIVISEQRRLYILHACFLHEGHCVQWPFSAGPAGIGLHFSPAAGHTPRPPRHSPTHLYPVSNALIFQEDSAPIRFM